MYSSILTSKGQVTIPADLMQALDLHPGDTLTFETLGHRLVIFKKREVITHSVVPRVVRGIQCKIGYE